MRVPMVTIPTRLKASAFFLYLLCSLLSAFTLAQDAATTAATGNAMVADGAPMTEEPGVTAASKYTCSLNGLVRRVEINYSAANATLPCDVNYYKDSEAPNEVNTLWSAQNLTGYCEQKAGEFVDKLQSWGWECNSL